MRSNVSLLNKKIIVHIKGVINDPFKYIFEYNFQQLKNHHVAQEQCDGFYFPALFCRRDRKADGDAGEAMSRYSAVPSCLHNAQKWI